MKRFALIPLLALAACDDMTLAGFAPPVEAPAPPPPVVETLDPTPPPPPPVMARTVEQFDTTTAEDRAEALAPQEVETEEALGTTVASLGSPAIPGIWMETPLVEALVMGRVEYEGQSVNVELRPSGGAPGSGSEISLAAMRLLEVPLTALPEVAVFR